MEKSSTKYSAVIIDDSKMARVSLLQDIIDHEPRINVIGEADGVVTGTKLIKEKDPNIVFLDIEMGDYTGFDLLDMVASGTQIIFVTGLMTEAIKAFQVDAVDYLVKPVDPKLLIQAVDKAIRRIDDSNTDTAYIHQQGFHFIPLMR